MKQLLLIFAMVVLVGCSNDTPETSQSAEAEPQVASKPTPVSPADEKLIVEKEIRRSLKKPKGELTEADLEKVTRLDLHDTKITDAGLKELAKLQKLAELYLNDVREVTKAGVAELQKALPNCRIAGP